MKHLTKITKKSSNHDFKNNKKSDGKYQGRTTNPSVPTGNKAAAVKKTFDTLASQRLAQKCLSRLPVAERSMASQQLCINTVGHNPILLLPLHVISPVELGEPPFPAHNDLLPSRKLELGPPQRLLGMRTVVILAPHGQKHLPNGNPGAGSQRLSKSSPHARLEAISSST
ncbi:hypothetical protein KSP40_PGU009794 [Platanthera guangdongensis]|uniref:Uncharacterized protein n=1 Tax=Platanthera guangdongensis TaxID=2320717 RepID=A0ABR2LQS8_9ASPA